MDISEKEEIVCVDDAEWDMSLNVTCPHCEHYFDVTDYETMGDLPKVRATDGLNLDIMCPECSRIFRITQIRT